MIIGLTNDLFHLSKKYIHEQIDFNHINYLKYFAGNEYDLEENEIENQNKHYTTLGKIKLK